MKIGSLNLTVPTSISVPGPKEVVEGLAKITVLALSAMTVNANKNEECALTKTEAEYIGYAVGGAVVAATAGLWWIFITKTDFNVGH